jgi:hypothetical protein
MDPRITVENRHLEALALGVELFEDPGRALVGLRGSKVGQTFEYGYMH